MSLFVICYSHFSVSAQRVKSPHTQQELFLEDMVHEGFAGNVLSDIKINKWAVLSSWKTPLGLFILLISDTRGTMAVIQAYLQSPLTKPGAFGPEAEPKAIYCPRTQEHVVDVVVFVYHYNKDATCSGLCCFFKHTLRFNRGPWVFQEPSWLSFHFFTELREIQACVVLCECIVYPCELCNNITAGCIFPPSTCCPWLHGLWPSKQTMKHSQMKEAVRFRCSRCDILTVLFSVLLPCRLGKLQDAQKKFCFSPWRSRSGSAVWPPTTFWR